MYDAETLEEKILARVREWFAHATPPLIKGLHDCASLEIRIGDLAEDDDGEPWLSLGVTETLHGPKFDLDSGGRVPAKDR